MTIKEIQQALIRNGYPIVADGISGAKTKAAIIDFQKKNGLDADGIVGPKTIAKLQGDLNTNKINIFISAGHHSKALTSPDTGAIGVDGLKEGDVTIEFRDLVCAELDRMGIKYIKDRDLDETLSQYLKRIETNSKSIVVEYHCNAFNKKATGTEVIIEDEADKNDVAFATELVDMQAKYLRIPNRGVKKEKESARGKLGLMREEGLVVLPELIFIDNPVDVQAYNQNKKYLATAHVMIIKKYSELINK